MDKYQQHELLGQGNSSVYRAIRLADKVEVALKRVKGWAALPPSDQATALSEVAALRAVDHPHATRLLDSFSDHGDLCLVLPLVRPGARAFADAALPLSPAAVARAGHAATRTGLRTAAARAKGALTGAWAAGAWGAGSWVTWHPRPGPG